MSSDIPGFKCYTPKFNYYTRLHLNSTDTYECIKKKKKTKRLELYPVYCEEKETS